MKSKLASTPSLLDAPQVLVAARAVLQAQAQAVLVARDHLDESFVKSFAVLQHCQGRVVVTGVGKSGLVGQKISSTLASTGTPSWFMHATEALHGDLGRISRDDVVLALSNSGESVELLQLCGPLKALGVTLLAMTGRLDSTLARKADVVLDLGEVAEACPMGLVPTSSTTVMLVVGDALALGLATSRGFNQQVYARFHPGGALGRQLKRVSQVMRTQEANPVVSALLPLRQVIAVMTSTQGRPGAASVVDSSGKLIGFFTDGDLRRLLAHPDFQVDIPISQVMHTHPKRIQEDNWVSDAVAILREHHIDQLPVIDAHEKPVGLLDIQDLLQVQ